MKGGKVKNTHRLPPKEESSVAVAFLPEVTATPESPPSGKRQGGKPARRTTCIVMKAAPHEQTGYLEMSTTQGGGQVTRQRRTRCPRGPRAAGALRMRPGAGPGLRAPRGRGRSDRPLPGL